MVVRAQNAEACVAELEKTFLGGSLDDWKARLAGFSGVWAPALAPAEVHEHVQVEANGYLPEVTSHDGATFRLPVPPMQFGGEPPRPQGPAPEFDSAQKSCSNWGTIGTPSPSSVHRARSGDDGDGADKEGEAMTWNYELYIDGKWTSGGGGGMIEVIDPATEESSGRSQTRRPKTRSGHRGGTQSLRRRSMALT